LPQLKRRDRLIGALDLLPRNQREDIVRILKLIFEGRPQAVHLRQDLFAAAIACAIAGVPKFLIHRGSLSPNLWGHGLLETNLFLRPMRHTYRRLLAHRNFCIVNNSSAGAQSDRDWTEWSDPEPFRAVHNAVEFGKLEREPHADLRRDAGIAHDAFLVGGIFRIEAVKRPMLWIETASLVAAACPQAHFVVLGDGAMAQQMRDFAQAHGFAQRLHMPGFVANVGEWLRVIDLNLLTSDREGLPNVLIEGQHFGVPAVSSDVGGAFETIEPGLTGHLVPVQSDANVFADAILKIIADPAWREAARRRAPAFVHAKFGIERTVDELLACLDLSTSNC
jgi:glycosyltransferase involved in cell wall biosynthesis